MQDQTRSDIALLYRRAGFGLRPEELDGLVPAGYDAAVDTLLSGLGTAPDPSGDQVLVPAFVAYQRSAAAKDSPAAQAANKAQRKVERGELASLETWWMNRMIVTDTPLREKLALFWHGHFATGSSKVRDAKLMYLQNEVFRTAGGGGFNALTQAMAKDGAMMVWLDTSTDKKADPNENFAREMMEIFTLGIGNYTQDDVVAGARAFTGWTYDRSDYTYVFRPRQHDYGSKTYLGQTGDWNGTDIVNIAVDKPVSARFIVAKLWSHFAYPVLPSDPIVSDLLPSYGSGLEVTPTLAAIFRHPDFTGQTSRTGLVKQPIEYLVGAARALGLDADLTPSPNSEAARAVTTGGGDAKAVKARPLAVLATALGQEPFNPPNVGGWGQNEYWLDTATSQLRLEMALVLAERADLTSVSSTPESQRLEAVASILGIDGWGSTTTAALNQVGSRPVALMALSLASPEYVLA